jgi:hypothetical protein
MLPPLKCRKVLEKQARALRKHKEVSIRGIVAARSTAGHYGPLFHLYTQTQCISILKEIKMILKVGVVF